MRVGFVHHAVMRAGDAVASFARSHGARACGAALLLSAAPALAQEKDDKEGFEEFEAVDPYTQGAEEPMDAAGYLGFGPFSWYGSDSTLDVARVLGDPPVLWVETDHFRIGSTLTSYSYGGDRDERKKLAAELDRFADRVGRIKPPKKRLDPWLRLHLYAQRAEALYAAFLEDFGLEESDFDEPGPYLGWSQKIRLLLCERQSEYQRFVRHYLNGNNETAWRYFDGLAGVGYAVNLQFLRRIHAQAGGNERNSAAVPLDGRLEASVTSGLATLFLEALRQNNLTAPLWISRAYSHRAVRRIDPRLVTDYGLDEGRTVGEDDYKWEPRVRNLCKIEFFAPAREMFGWEDPSALGVREHMTAWSRLDYLLDELDGDDRGFLLELCQPNLTGHPSGTGTERVERQVEALQRFYGRTPEEFDEGWQAWVKKTYARR